MAVFFTAGEWIVKPGQENSSLPPGRQQKSPIRRCAASSRPLDCFVTYILRDGT